jgi:glutathione S-transferase
MADLILHHYPMSPFAEKARLMLGRKRLAWKSVEVPSIMPKPDVLALTGGYRKTPFLQIGSHIYCDTSLIGDVLEHIAPAPALYPAQHKGLARVIAQWADEKLFWAAMGHNFHPKGVAQLFGGGPPEQWGPQAKVFAEDRSKMRQGMPRITPSDAAASYKSYLRRLANMLHGQHYLLGAEPCIADLAAYHPLWFTRTQTSAMAGILDATPEVLAWMDRVKAIGHGSMTESNAQEAIAICAASPGVGAVLPGEPFQDEHGIALGSQVSVASEGFGPEPTLGELVAATRMHYTLKRVDERAGVVFVHFPRVGFQLRQVN